MSTVTTTLRVEAWPAGKAEERKVQSLNLGNLGAPKLPSRQVIICRGSQVLAMMCGRMLHSAGSFRLTEKHLSLQGRAPLRAAPARMHHNNY